VLHSSPSSVQFPSAAQDRLSIVKPTTITTMPFHQELKRKREAAKLSQETAASWLRLAARDYGDRESGRVDMQFPEKFGLLVGIGVPPNEAADIADRTDELCMDEWGEQSNASAADLFVRESATQIILSNRTDERLDYPIAKSSIKNPWHIVDLVVDLGGKTWVTKTHLKAFAVTALRYLRDGSQTTRSRPRL